MSSVLDRFLAARLWVTDTRMQPQAVHERWHVEFVLLLAPGPHNVCVSGLDEHTGETYSSYIPTYTARSLSLAAVSCRAYCWTRFCQEHLPQPEPFLYP